MPVSIRLLCIVSASLCALGVAAEAHAENGKPTYAVADTLNLAGSTRWDYLTFDASRHRLFITRGDSVDVLDTDSKTIVGTIPGLKGVHGVALAPGFNKGFITEGKNNRVSVFDLATLQILTTIPTGAKPDAVVYDEATQRVFAADGDSGDLTAIDAASGAAIGAIALGGQPEFIAADGTGRVYVNLEDKSEIAIVDARTLKLLARYDLAPGCKSPTGLAMDQADKRLFAVCANKEMLVVDAGTGKILDTLPIGQHSDAAAFDPATGLAFASNGDGTLTIVSAAEEGGYKVAQTVATKPAARTMALDPMTHKIYLAAAEIEGFDPPTESHPDPRPRIKPDSFMILTVSPSR